MLKVTVKVYGTLLSYVPGRQQQHELELEAPVTAHAILERLGIPEEEVWMVSVANRQVAMEYEVVEGEDVSIFPPVTGG